MTFSYMLMNYDGSLTMFYQPDKRRLSTNALLIVNSSTHFLEEF